MSYQEHQRASQSIAARCAVITLSDSRKPATDTSGQAIVRLLSEAGHEVVQQQLIRDEPLDLETAITAMLGHPGIDVIVSNGGTGIGRRDQTIAVFQRLIDIQLPGFGELFRMLSYQQIGSGAILSRALGGVSRGKLLFALPGSTQAVELAMGKLICPELSHLLRELRR